MAYWEGDFFPLPHFPLTDFPVGTIVPPGRKIRKERFLYKKPAHTGKAGMYDYK